jgi:hypothetical protein
MVLIKEKAGVLDVIPLWVGIHGGVFILPSYPSRVGLGNDRHLLG